MRFAHLRTGTYTYGGRGRERRSVRWRERERCREIEMPRHMTSPFSFTPRQKQHEPTVSATIFALLLPRLAPAKGTPSECLQPLAGTSTELASVLSTVSSHNIFSSYTEKRLVPRAGALAGCRQGRIQTPEHHERDPNPETASFLQHLNSSMWKTVPGSFCRSVLDYVMLCHVIV